MALEPEFKTDWVAELRSGKYQQALGGMKRTFANGTVGYCCLGVAARVIRDKHPQFLKEAGVKIREDDQLSVVDRAAQFVSFGHLTEGLAKAIGLSNAQMSCLVGKNDDLFMSFSEIADYIEANL